MKLGPQQLPRSRRPPEPDKLVGSSDCFLPSASAYRGKPSLTGVKLIRLSAAHPRQASLLARGSSNQVLDAWPFGCRHHPGKKWLVAPLICLHLPSLLPSLLLKNSAQPAHPHLSHTTHPHTIHNPKLINHYFSNIPQFNAATSLTRIACLAKTIS